MEEKEEERIQGERIEAPDTKWAFEGNLMVEVKAFQDPGQPLKIGAVILPAWLRNKKGLMPLDTYDDNLCVVKCRAVRQRNGRRYSLRKLVSWQKKLFLQITTLKTMK